MAIALRCLAAETPFALHLLPPGRGAEAQSVGQLLLIAVAARLGRILAFRRVLRGRLLGVSGGRLGLRLGGGRGRRARYQQERTERGSDEPHGCLLMIPHAGSPATACDS